MLIQKMCLLLRNSFCSLIFTTFIFLIMTFTCLGCSTQGQPMEVSTQPIVSKVQEDSIGAPKLAIEKTSYDFGEIKPGSKNTATFRFSNAGDLTPNYVPATIRELSTFSAVYCRS